MYLVCFIENTFVLSGTHNQDFVKGRGFEIGITFWRGNLVGSVAKRVKALLLNDRNSVK